MPPHTTRAQQSRGRARSKRHAAHQQREHRLQRDHETHARAPVRQVGPHKTQYIGKRRRATHQPHGEIDHETRRHPGKVLLDEYRRGGALDQPERQAEKSPGKNLAAVDALRNRTGSDDTASGHPRSLIARGWVRIPLVDKLVVLVLTSGDQAWFASMTSNATTALRCAAPRAARRPLLVLPALLLLSGSERCGARANA